MQSSSTSPNFSMQSGQIIGKVDVLLAGPPCQGHSNLNNRRRTDKRNQPYLTVPAVAIALEVNAVVIENVQAVVHDRTQVVSSAAHLLKDAGYHIEVGVVSAADIGWPQTRKRYFLVARRDRPPVPLSDVSDALRTEPQPVSWVFEDLPAAELGISCMWQPNSVRKTFGELTSCLIMTSMICQILAARVPSRWDNLWVCIWAAACRQASANHYYRVLDTRPW